MTSSKHSSAYKPDSLNKLQGMIFTLTLVLLEKMVIILLEHVAWKLFMAETSFILQVKTTNTQQHCDLS